MIREDGLDTAYTQRSQFEKAMELPTPIVHESPDERIRRLEDDQAVLLDMISDLTEQVKRPVIELTVGGMPMKIEPAPAIKIESAPASCQTDGLELET
jgi:hypothetical protein